jgi:hypothetical protein
VEALGATAVAIVQGYAQAGAGFVGDCMQRQQRLTHSAFSSERQFLDRHIGALAEEPPLIGDMVGQWAGPVLRPGAPAPVRLLDRLRPVGEPVEGVVDGDGVANTSGGHSRRRSVIRAPLAAYQVDAGVCSLTPSSFRQWPFVALPAST